MRLLAAAFIAIAAAAPAAPRTIDITVFFTGNTHAENVLKVALKKPVPLIVDSVGGKGDRGDFVLIDTVHEGDKPVRQRKWIMHPTGPNRYGGSLTDATGPVDVMITGAGATIRYMMKGGLKIEQVIEVQDGGRTATNRVVAKKFGLTFAHVDGTIRKLD